MDKLRIFHANIYVSLSTSELRISLVPLNMFKPSSNVLTDRSKWGNKWSIHFAFIFLTFKCFFKIP